MEISTLTKKEYEQDKIQTRITEIFSPEKYAAAIVKITTSKLVFESANPKATAFMAMAKAK